MKRPVVAIDIDDVIAESTESLRRRVNEHTGINLSSEDYKIEASYWGYYEGVWRTHGVSHLVDMETLNQQMQSNQSHVPLMPGAEFAINELRKKFDIVLITARDPRWERATREWLKDQFGEHEPELYFSEMHRSPAGTKTKGEICREIGAGWMIDDNPGFCQTVLDNGVKAILFGEYGWHINVPKEVIRCKDWQAVLEYFAHG